MAPILIASIHLTINQENTRKWNVCHAPLISDYSSASKCLFAHECDVALEWYCIHGANGDGILDPKDTWYVLCQNFEQITVTDKVFMLMQLYELHMKRITQIQEPLWHIDELSDHLAAVGVVVSDVH